MLKLFADVSGRRNREPPRVQMPVEAVDTLSHDDGNTKLPVSLTTKAGETGVAPKPKTKPKAKGKSLPKMKRPAAAPAADPPAKKPCAEVVAAAAESQDEPPGVMKKPSAKPTNKKDENKTPKVSKYLYHRDGIWGIKRDGSQVVIASRLKN